MGASLSRLTYYRLGYIFSLIGAIVMGIVLCRLDVPIGPILAVMAFAWAGGIFFLLLVQERQHR